MCLDCERRLQLLNAIAIIEKPVGVVLVWPGMNETDDGIAVFIARAVLTSFVADAVWRAETKRASGHGGELFTRKYCHHIHGV